MATNNDKNKFKDVLTELKRGVEEVLIEEELLEPVPLEGPAWEPSWSWLPRWSARQLIFKHINYELH